MTQRRFPPDIVGLLERAEEVDIEPRAPDGKPTKRVTIWIVAVDGDVYVRSVRGGRGQWYRALIRQPEGVLQVGRRAIPFRAVRVDDPATIAAVTEAYRQKYERRWPSATAPMIRGEALDTTLRLEPLPA
jgi:hypothetical protein